MKTIEQDATLKAIRQRCDAEEDERLTLIAKIDQFTAEQKTLAEQIAAAEQDKANARKALSRALVAQELGEPKTDGIPTLEKALSKATAAAEMIDQRQRVDTLREAIVMLNERERAAVRRKNELAEQLRAAAANAASQLAEQHAGEVMRLWRLLEDAMIEASALRGAALAGGVRVHDAPGHALAGQLQTVVEGLAPRVMIRRESLKAQHGL